MEKIELLTCGLYHIQGGKNLLNLTNDTSANIKQINAFINNDVLTKQSNLNFFIGSGCSTPAISLMGDTLKSILSRDEIVKQEFIIFLGLDEETTEIFEKYLNSELTDDEWLIANKYDNFSNIEAFMTYLKNKINVERDNAEKERLEELFEIIKDEFINSIPKHDAVEYEGDVANIYNEFYKNIFASRQYETPKLNVFTTNYDLFNEIALETNNIQYSTGFTNTLEPFFNINQFNYRLVDERNRYKDKWQPTTKEANLYKLHGSINWIAKGSKIISSNTNDGNVIIYPTILKHQETTQSPYSELFRELSIQLQRPNSTLVVIGYGFGDDHINNIIFQNLLNEDFTLIIFGDKEESRVKKVIQNYTDHHNLHIIGGEVIEDKERIKMHYFNNILKYFISKEEKMNE